MGTVGGGFSGFYHGSKVVKVVKEGVLEQMGNLVVLGGQRVLFINWQCGVWIRRN